MKNIFREGELNEDVVISILETSKKHGAIKGKTQKSSTQFYNLDAIISVGYRVNSSSATKFRIWATNTLKSYINYIHHLQLKINQRFVFNFEQSKTLFELSLNTKTFSFCSRFRYTNC